MKPVHAAIIYCRVSSKKQELDGDGNGSQEHLCRNHAAKLGVPVEAVYTDSKSGYGDYMERPGMVGVLKHLKSRRGKRYVVIFDDLKRFARRTRFYWELRDRLADFGAVVDSPNFRFEDSPEGRHHETITVAGGELEREQLRRQAIQKMTARVERGYAVTAAPVGYEYRSVKRNGRILFPKEPEASIVREALEGRYNRRCRHYGRSIKRDALEAAFASLLASVQPLEGVFRAARQMFEDAWKARIAASDTHARAMQTTLSSADRQIQQLLDRLVETESTAVAKAYEERVERLQAEKLAIAEKLQSVGKPVLDFDSAVRTALNFLENPMKLWASERVEQKRLALRLVFAQHLEFDREAGFRTAHLSLPFRALASISEPILGPIQGLVGRDDNCLNPELAEFRAWDQVFGVLQDWNRSLVAQEPPKDGP